MASGTINFSSNNSYLAGKIEWSSTSNGSNANSSNVTATLYIRRTNNYTTTGTWTGVLNIGGEEKSFSIHTSVSSGWVRMQGFTKTIGHNNDGSGSCWISGYCNGPSGTSMSGTTVTGSQTVTLDKIARYLSITQFNIQTRQINKVVVKWATSDPRDYTQYSLNNGAWHDDTNFNVSSDNKSGTFEILNLSPNTKYSLKIRCRRTDSQMWTESSTISFTTYDYAKLTSVPNINIGSSQTIKWTNPNNASISLKLCKTDNSQIINYGSVTGTSKTVTPTASTIYALTPNSNTYKARYIITTTQNNKTYTNSKDFTFTVTNSNPTFSNFDYVDLSGVTTALTGNNKILVNKYSNVSVTITSTNKATSKNSATMKSYKLSSGSKNETKNYSSSSTITFTAFGPTTGSIKVSATDSRNNSTSVTKTATFKNYTEPVIKNFEAVRNNNGVGSEVTLKFSGTYWNDNFGAIQNSIVGISYNYKETSSSSYSTAKTLTSFTAENGEFSGEILVQGDLGAKGFDVSKTFNIQLNVVDKLSETHQIVTLGAGAPAIAIYKDSVSIGGKYDVSENSKLQVHGKINISSGNADSNGLMSDGEIIFRVEEKNLIISALNLGNIYIRPQNTENTNYQIVIDKNGILNLNNNINFYNSGTNKRGINGTVASSDTFFFGGGATENDAGYAEISTGDNGSEPIFARQYTSNNLTRSATILDNNGNTSFPGTLSVNVDERVYGEKVLYNNNSGSAGIITLSETAENFSYLEIFYSKDGAYYNSTKVFAPNNKSVGLFYGYKTNDNVQFGFREIKISGTSITNTSYVGGINITNNYTDIYSTIELRINRVIGYR